VASEPRLELMEASASRPVASPSDCRLASARHPVRFRMAMGELPKIISVDDHVIEPPNV
jgi:hypothetical protein